MGRASQHYSYLTQLPEQYPTIENMHVSIERLRNGGWHRPYKLLPGTTDQHVALDMLGEEGVDGAIVDMSREVLVDVTEHIG